MQTARHWRLNAQRYALQGITCPHCATNIFPPREVCPHCQAPTRLVRVETEQRPARVAVSAVLETAAR